MDPLRCTELLGNINDPSAVLALRRRLGGDFDIDPVDFEWDEVRRRTGRKRSAEGRVVDLDFTCPMSYEGLLDGDVLAALPGCDFGAKGAVVAVRLLSARVLRIAAAGTDPLVFARAAWEIGNMHVPVFSADDGAGLVAPYSEPLARVLARIEGLEVVPGFSRLDPAHRLSGNGLSTLVRLAPDVKIVVRGS